MGDPVQFKEEGNKHFQAGEIDQAIECYTKAIKACKDKKTLAVIYRNRSACYLKKVEIFSPCLYNLSQHSAWHISILCFQENYNYAASDATKGIIHHPFLEWNFSIFSSLSWNECSRFSYQLQRSTWTQQMSKLCSEDVKHWKSLANWTWPLKTFRDVRP